MRQAVPAVRRLASVALASLALAACEEPVPTSTGNAIESYITGVSARDNTVQAALTRGAPPSGTAGPTNDVAGISSVVNGGSASVALAGSDTFQRVVVGVVGAEGWYDLLLPDGTTLEDVVLNLATGLGAGQLRVRYAVEGPSGLGPFQEQVLRVLRVGTGDVQISVAWSGASDVDLLVVDPEGTELYYGDKESPSGGSLDLDSNAACNIDNKNNENVVWPRNVAPAGQYTVRVYYFDDCGVPASDWVVTVQMRGQAPQTFTGRFTGASGSGNPPVTVGTFNFVP